MDKSIEDFLSSHPYSPSTKETYARILIELTKHADLQDWTATKLLNFVSRPNWGNSMQYVALCACRKYLTWRYGQHPSTTARIKRVKPKKQRSMSLKRVIELLASFDPSTPIGARDLALATVAIDTGLRASELARLRLEDIDLENRTLQVIVKGGQWGIGVYSSETALAIEKWLHFRTPATGTTTLFVSLVNNKNRGKNLTRHGVKSIFKKWGLSLGWKVSPHDARRTLGNVATALGAPQAVTMAAGRWSSEEAFRRYTQEITALAITPYLPVHHALKSAKS